MAYASFLTIKSFDKIHLIRQVSVIYLIYFMVIMICSQKKRIELLHTPNNLRKRCLADTIFVLRDGGNFHLDEIYEILCDNIVKGDRKMKK